MISHLASGGMAELYLARRRDADPDGPCVVLKRILPEHARNPHFVGRSRLLRRPPLAERPAGAPHLGHTPPVTEEGL